MSRSKPDRTQLIETVAREGRNMGTRMLLFHSVVAERLGLNPSDHKCAEFVFNEPAGMTPGRLAELTGLSTGAITGVVDRLERAGFVRRAHDPLDRRRVLIEATPERAPNVEPYFLPMFEAVLEVCSHYDDREVEVIADYMRRMGEAVEKLRSRMRTMPAPREPRPAANRSAPVRPRAASPPAAAPAGRRTAKPAKRAKTTRAVEK
jgi:DNA-binding MarR family transcriptional regulator